VEESGDGSLGGSPFLHIVDDEHVNGLVETDEIVDSILSAGISELHLEEACRYIKHATLGEQPFAFYADSIDEMGLAEAGRSKHKKRIERRLPWMLSDSNTHRAWKLVGITLDEVLERLLRIKLGVELLRHCCIENGRRLISARSGLRAVDAGGAVALYLHHLAILAIDHEAIGQLDVIVETGVESPSQQTHVVLLQVLVDVLTWNLNEHCLLLLIVAFEDNGLEPRFVYLLCYVLPDLAETVVPEGFMTLLHQF